MNVHSSKIILLIALLATSCELIVDVDVPYDGDKVVVNALQQTDSTWYVDLSLTRNIVGPEFYDYISVTNARVTIYNPDGSQEELTITPPSLAFRGSSYPQEGQKYRIRVEPYNMEAVEAEMTMPVAVPIIEVKWDSTEVRQHPDPYYYNIPFTLKFHDPPGVNNYYAVQVYSSFSYISGYDQDGQPIRDTIAHVREVALRDDPAIATEEDFKKYFADRTFDGQTYTAHFDNQFYTSPDQPVIEIKVTLISMSEENYKYQETLQLQGDVDGDPFAQPVQVFSNISNGFGIFAGNSVDTRTWKR